MKLLATEPAPFAVQVMALDVLTYFYDKLNRKSHAVEAKRAWLSLREQLQSRYRPLVTDSEIIDADWDLGLRYEEIGKYHDSIDFYQDAASRSLKSKDGKEFDRFEADIGRSRCLRRLGQVSEAEGICHKWQTRLAELGHKLDGEYWDGEQLTKATWELSCGNFDHGLDMMKAVALRYVKSPDLVDTGTPVQLFASLETIYRARGEQDLANVANDIAMKLLPGRSFDLNQLLQESEVLFRTHDIANK